MEIVATDPQRTVEDLKNEEGMDIWLLGGGTLAHALLPEIDRFVIKQHPAVIAFGVPLFNGPFEPRRFRPAGLRELDSGVRILSFERPLPGGTRPWRGGTINHAE